MCITSVDMEFQATRCTGDYSVLVTVKNSVVNVAFPI